ncbi:hypothetical protein [Sigmofec virus UA08Rod_6044]|uniref:Uncharacterized protein n=1 Tax=Sigmofec virus UA08Rod_6044 TaxID=2929448 RepID=A0A976R8H9_9VIRU|nr:hypothetical protein [Sigmofec virus UA08Rod_6044]
MIRNKVFTITQGTNDLETIPIITFINKDIEEAICNFEHTIKNLDNKYYYKLILLAEIKNKKLVKNFNIVRRKSPYIQKPLIEVKKQIDRAKNKKTTTEIITELFEGRIINE